MGKSHTTEIQHYSKPATIDIPAGQTDSAIFRMGENPILSLNFNTPGVNTHLKAQARIDAEDTFRDVKKPDGTDWTFPTGAGDITSSGAIGANSFSDFVGLGDVKFIAQLSQTGGWPMQIIATG